MAIQVSPEILDTIGIVQLENLDIRTITMGISVRNRADSRLEAAARESYEKICRSAERLVASASGSIEYGIPLVHKGATPGDCVVDVGVRGPGVVANAVEAEPHIDFGALGSVIKQRGSHRVSTCRSQGPVPNSCTCRKRRICWAGTRAR
jgi:uncharacterized protein (UPF0210 family)